MDGEDWNAKTLAFGGDSATSAPDLQLAALASSMHIVSAELDE